MCGIVGAIAERDVVPLLLEGLRRLEYRGYDSAGLAVVDREGLQRCRTVGKVEVLATELKARPISGTIGIAHTRWATHGRPASQNAHPHQCRNRVALVHNGIIENHERLRAEQLASGYEFTSETDTEVVAHQLHHYLDQGESMLSAVQSASRDLEGAYALAVITPGEDDRMVVARRGSPLVIGIGIGEHLIASDISALLPITRRFIFLEEGDVAELTRESVTIYDAAGNVVERAIKESDLAPDVADRGEFRHYMLKEIYEQPMAISETLEGRLAGGKVLEAAFGPQAEAIFDRIKRIQIIACGTSFHAGQVARNWFEGLAGIPCRVEVASEFRYRHPVPDPEALIVTISQSGETADTLAALRAAKEWGYGASLAVCNVPESSLVREADLSLMTRAGPEIGVASTKAFTTQLVALLLLVVSLGRRYRIDSEREAKIVEQLLALPSHIEDLLSLDDEIHQLAERFTDKQHALFLGRGVQYPVAMEGALKLKEISYIHAEAYPAGELKHGPLALVDEEMPVIAVAPNDALLEKLKANLEEVRARGGELYVFADHASGMSKSERVHVTVVPPAGDHVAPIIFTVPLQLLAYHVAVLKGTDVDQPRNLAKSVTVE
ncbi:glutamine--fructose-6-phosphate aminotransferase [Solemya pervernicosa gill symbiont]|uniref:Glutamine--fructose-6-phosphate aminotransferase [isomerizing] n=2 Tax=Gammaproteobacteria incertae sedis TaxID=118884 RepID=A0A1T2L365_9GAMM|nr:glutamine--fructose-6-phosphate transaminase (isomerizing) [Candidatus Reidiella endopervernicosa]OOZ39376.1 glutamine--fructose-6-phosphate aminotransferase [Solemya pervernicosa gill symbiont]QKQ25320.1 glutamine--fructose-6-phosphate transaminase (isomerizing) [Candidatus Reidiella endopervernicosa]